MSVKLYLQTALQIGNDVKLFTFNKIKLKQQIKRLSVWFFKLSFKKYLLNNLLMLFYFSNVKRQRFFSFFVRSALIFFIRRMEEEHFFGQPRPQGAFPWLWGRGGTCSCPAPKAREKRPGDEVVFWAHPHRLRTSTVFSFSAIRRLDKLVTERTFFVLFS